MVAQVEEEGKFPQADYAFDNGVLRLELTRLIESKGKHWVSEVESSRHILWQDLSGEGLMKWPRNYAKRIRRVFAGSRSGVGMGRGKSFGRLPRACGSNAMDANVSRWGRNGRLKRVARRS